MLGRRKVKAKSKHTDRFVGIIPRKADELKDRYRKVLKIFSRYKFDRILDVGCGDGNFSVLLKEACKAKEVYGIEISEKDVESARKNGVKAYQLDIDEGDFPFEDNYFDAIFAGEVIEHLYDTDHFLDEIYRVLKENGVFVLTTPNLASWQNRISLLLGYQPYATSPSLRYRIGHLFGDSDLLPEEIIQSRRHISVFSIHQLDILKVEGSSIAIPPKYMKFHPLHIKLNLMMDKLLSRIPSLAPDIIIVSYKNPSKIKCKATEGHIIGKY
jgi:methionine biosynthesis protein MetW